MKHSRYEAENLGFALGKKESRCEIQTFASPVFPRSRWNRWRKRWPGRQAGSFSRNIRLAPVMPRFRCGWTILKDEACLLRGFRRRAGNQALAWNAMLEVLRSPCSLVLDVERRGWNISRLPLAIHYWVRP